MIIDLFAGPGGWSQGLKELDPDLHATEIGFEWDTQACATRHAAGHQTIQTDIANYPIEQFKNKTVGIIASPPCQDFSLAGKKLGIEGERGQLITETVRWIEGLQPEWFACEQVPPALNIWKDYAQHFRTFGYSVWCGILNAADYGVPQTRRRAILIGSKTRTLDKPEPTHAKDPQPTLFGELQPWVTMAEALGWGRHSPAWTLAPGTGQGGSDPLMMGGSGIRKTVQNEIERGSWVLNPGRTEAQRNRRLYELDEPAPTIAFGHDSANWNWQINTGCMFKVKGDRSTALKFKPDDQPSYTITAKVGGQWFIEDANETESASQDRTLRMTVEDALVLQSFPHNYPVQGSKTKQFEQIGNAVPPRLAAHILATVTGQPHPYGAP